MHSNFKFGIYQNKTVNLWICEAYRKVLLKNMSNSPLNTMSNDKKCTSPLNLVFTKTVSIIWQHSVTQQYFTS